MIVGVGLCRETCSIPSPMSVTRFDLVQVGIPKGVTIKVGSGEIQGMSACVWEFWDRESGRTEEAYSVLHFHRTCYSGSVTLPIYYSKRTFSSLTLPLRMSSSCYVPNIRCVSCFGLDKNICLRYVSSWFCVPVSMPLCRARTKKLP